MMRVAALSAAVLALTACAGVSVAPAADPVAPADIGEAPPRPVFSPPPARAVGDLVAFTPEAVLEIREHIDAEWPAWADAVEAKLRYWRRAALGKMPEGAR